MPNGLIFVFAFWRIFLVPLPPRAFALISARFAYAVFRTYPGSGIRAYPRAALIPALAKKFSIQLRLPGCTSVTYAHIGIAARSA
jgi:hypothetical protein